MKRAIIVTTVVLAWGCAHASRSKDPRNWLELESEHFVLRTDVLEEQARKSLDEMEQVREALVGIPWTGAHPAQARVIVVLLADQSELAEFQAKHFEGFATYNAFRQEMIVIHAGQDVYRQSLFKHELTHVLSSGLAMPRWASEGLACAGRWSIT